MSTIDLPMPALGTALVPTLAEGETRSEEHTSELQSH